jgi:hypothetical protein
MQDGAAWQGATQRLLRATEQQTKPQDGQREVEGEGPMARATLAVELQGYPIGLLAVAGEGVLPTARMDEETHPMAAPPVWWRLVAQALRV